MPQQVRCADLMPGCSCSFVMEGEDADEILAKAAQHAKQDHGMARIPPEITVRIRAAVGDK